MTIRVGIAGVTGRLGTLVAEAVLASDGAALAGGLVRPGGPGAPLPPGIVAFDDPRALAAVSDVLIDVSHADAVVAHAASVRDARIAWVLGVTGLDEAADDAIAGAAREVPVLVAANFAPGASLVIALARILAAACPPAEYDAEIVEMHHSAKRDAPSGTALAIGRVVAEGRGTVFDAVAARGRVVAEARGTVFDAVAVGGRDAQIGPRAAGAIDFASLRGGLVVGEHALVFTSGTEQITLAHRAFDRRVFADGALAAALWLAGRAPGRYGMEDVLGLS